MFEIATKQITPIAIWGMCAITTYIVIEGLDTIATKIKTEIVKRKAKKVLEQEEA